MLVSGDSGEQPEMGPAMSESVRAGRNIWISALSLLDVGYHSGDGSAPDGDASEFSGLAEMYEIAESVGLWFQNVKNINLPSTHLVIGRNG